MLPQKIEQRIFLAAGKPDPKTIPVDVCASAGKSILGMTKTEQLRIATRAGASVGQYTNF